MSEPFYAPLSTRLSEKNLSSWLRKSIDEYKVAKDKLVTELIQTIEATQKMDPEMRQRTLTALAAEQTPKLAALEVQADQFRTDLLRSGLVGFFAGTGNWNQDRQWRLGKGRLELEREQVLYNEYQVMRAAVFYQEGLSIAQRRLLREVAMELQVAALKPTRVTATAEDRETRYFMPAATRVRFSGKLSPEVSAKIAAFDDAKKSLKKELRDTLYNEDRESESHRVAALKSLAAQQEAGLAMLEVLAEDIRISLERSGFKAQPSPQTTVPDSLEGKIAKYRKDKEVLQKELQEQLRQIANVKKVDVTEEGEAGLRAKKITLSVADSKETAVSNIQARLKEFNQQHAAQFKALADQEDAIRAEIARKAGLGIDPRLLKSVDTLVSEFNQSLEEQSRWPRYKEYEWAALLPGLSPEQRRALFDKAVAGLELPLPGGEYSP